MVRVVFVLLLLLTSFGCKNEAQSQEHASAPPQRAEAVPADVNGAIDRSRHNAITQAVKAATPAIVSVNVIEVQRVRYRDPLSDFFSDPFFEQFLGQRRSRVMEREVQNVGSGFVISPDGYIVTNDHVAGNATKITVSFPDGKTLDATLVGTDQAADLSLLKVEADHTLPYLALSETPPIVGEWAIALGNPFGLFEAAEPSVTVGVVSATGRDLSVTRDNRIYRDMIQTDASINRGNSGGPLVNALGEVIGINTAIYSESGGSIGIGFAVPSAKVRRIVDELRTNGAIDRDYYTGLQGADVTDRIAQELNLSSARGVIVARVVPDSPADRAGFLPYDVIVSVEDEQVDDFNDYIARLYDFRPGDTLRYVVLRDGQRRELQMLIAHKQG